MVELVLDPPKNTFGNVEHYGPRSDSMDGPAKTPYYHLNKEPA